MVRTKGRKTFTSIFFPVGPAPREIVSNYAATLRDDLGFSDDDPIFPSTQIGRGEDRGFVAQGLSQPRGAEPDKFEGFSARLSRPLSFPTQTLAAFVTQSLGPLDASESRQV